jgi:orotate phosphoribosyltransferase
MPRPSELIHSDLSSKKAAYRAAQILIDIKAVNFRPDDPYTFTSGRKSPSYIDCRRIISFPSARTELNQLAIDLIERDIGKSEVDIVAGGETAGIPFSAWIADSLDKPMVYVRKKSKGFGRMGQIEGEMPEESKVLLVEDLTTDGGSKLNFIDALRKAGAKVNHTYVVFHYGIFKESLTNMSKLGVKLHALATWWDVLDVARENNLYTSSQLDIVENYLDDPESWSHNN